VNKTPQAISQKALFAERALRRLASDTAPASCVIGAGGSARRAGKGFTMAAARVVSPLLLAGVFLAGCEEPVSRSFEYLSTSPIYSTPAITKDLIIFGSENGELVALNRKGEFAWKYSTRRDVVGAVKVAKDTVLFGSTNNVFYALDMQGREIWKYTTLARIKGDPLAMGNTVVFGSYDKHVYARQINNGKEVWTFPPEAPPPAEPGLTSTPAPAAGTPPKEAEKGAAAKPATAVQPVPASPVDPVPSPAPKIEPMDGFSYSSPVLVGQNVVLGNLDGYIYAIDFKTGSLVWRFKTDGADQKRGVTSTVLETSQGLVFGANDGHVYCISKDGQRVVWKYKTGDEVNATVATDAEGNLYVGSVDRKLYALSGDGKEKWKFDLSGPVLGKAGILRNLVVFAGGTGDQTIYAVDKGTGKLFWSFPTQAKVETDVLVDGNTIYVGSGDKRMYAFTFNKTVPD
jgi:outer membrane protein assembly factor BamB